MVTRQRIRTRSLSSILISCYTCKQANWRNASLAWASATSIQRNWWNQLPNRRHAVNIPPAALSVYYETQPSNYRSFAATAQSKFSQRKGGSNEKAPLLIDRSLSATRKFKFVITRYSRPEGKRSPRRRSRINSQFRRSRKSDSPPDSHRTLAIRM